MSYMPDIHFWFCTLHSALCIQHLALSSSSLSTLITVSMEFTDAYNNDNEILESSFGDQWQDGRELDLEADDDLENLDPRSSDTMHGAQALPLHLIPGQTPFLAAHRSLGGSVRNQSSLRPALKAVRIKLKIGFARLFHSTIHLRMPQNTTAEEGLPLLLEQVSSLAQLRATVPIYLRETVRFYGLSDKFDYVAIGMPTVRNGVADENMRTVGVRDGQWEQHVQVLQDSIRSHGSAFVDCECAICTRGISIYLLYKEDAWLQRLSPDRRYLAMEPIQYLDAPSEELIAELQAKDAAWADKARLTARRVPQTQARLRPNRQPATPASISNQADLTLPAPNPLSVARPVNTNPPRGQRKVTLYKLNPVVRPPIIKATYTDYLTRATDRPQNYPHSKTPLESCLTCVHHGKLCHRAALYGPDHDRRCWNCSREPGSGKSRQCLWQDRARGVVTFDQAYAVLDGARQRRIPGNTSVARAQRERERRVRLVRELGGRLDLQAGVFELPPATVVLENGRTENGLRLEIEREYWVEEE